MSRRTTKFASCLSLVVLVVVVVAGCSDHGDRQMDVSRIKDYTSLAQLKQDSQFVIVGAVMSGKRGGPADQGGTSQIDTYLTTIRVVVSSKGSVAAGSKITIRQVAASVGNKAFDFTLKPAISYVLFLKIFTFGSGTNPTGQYVVTGGVGAYTLTSGNVTDVKQTARLADGIESRLPQTASLAELLSV